MKPRSLIARLTGLQALWLSLTVLVFAAGSLWLVSGILEQSETRELTAEASRLAENLVRERTERPTAAQAAQDVIEEEPPTDMWIRIRDPGGVVLAQNRDPEPAEPAGTESGKPERKDRPDRHRESYRLPDGFSVEASISVEPRRRTVRVLTLVLLGLVLPIVAGHVFVLRRRVADALRPLERMNAAAALASADDSIVKLGESSGYSEVDELAGSFERLLRRRNDLLQAERLFIQEASHELRTPITGIRGELELSLRGHPDAEMIRNNLGRALRQARQLEEIIDALLLLHKARGRTATPGDLQPVNLADVVREVSRDLLAQHPKRAADVGLNVPDECLVAGTEPILSTAVRNLLDNALKFTTRGEAIRVSMNRSPDAVVLRVEDSGRGIPPPDRQRVFAPFFRTPGAQAVRPGSGIGLALVREIINALGGRVFAADSELGGTVLQVVLPPWRVGGPPAP